MKNEYHVLIRLISPTVKGKWHAIGFSTGEYTACGMAYTELPDDEETVEGDPTFNSLLDSGHVDIDDVKLEQKKVDQ